MSDTPPLPPTGPWSHMRDAWEQAEADAPSMRVQDCTASMPATGVRVTPAACAWEEFKNDFDAMTDNDIIDESRRMADQLDEAEAWLEAVSAWEAAGRPRTTEASR